MALEDAPIAQFTEYFDPKAGDYLVIVDIATGETKKIKAQYFGQTSPSTNYKWVSGFDYLADAIVDYQGKWYLSLQTPNLGKTPTLNPLYWELQTKAAAGFVAWQAGVYTGTEVYVLRQVDGFTQLFKLATGTRPYLSSNFEDEFALGAWELMSERGYLAINKSTHGWAVNNVLTFKAGAWEIYAPGDNQLAIVRSVIDADAVIIVLLNKNLLRGMSGLTPGAMYYIQDDGTVDTVLANDPIFLALSATQAILI